MKKLISELRELIDNKHRLNGMSNYAYADFDEKLKKMEALINSNPKPKKDKKFVELMDKGVCYILKRKDISSIAYRIAPHEKVTICMKNGKSENYSVSENHEVLENLIADFKG